MELKRDIALKTVLAGIGLNLLLAIVKGSTGYFGNSYALIADGIESTTDVFSSLILFLGLRYATKPADKNHPYGHGRAEPLMTFCVVVFLVVSAGVIAYHSILNIQTPHSLPKPFTLWVLVGVVVLKELVYRVVRKRNAKVNSSALKAEAWHHRSDAITSLFAFAGISVALYLGPGYEAADDWAALAAVLIILYNAYLIFRPALGEIMDEHVYDDLILKIREESKKVEGILDTEKCHVRKSGLYYLVDLHVLVSGDLTVEKGHELAHNLKNHLTTTLPDIADILMHVEPY